MMYEAVAAGGKAALIMYAIYPLSTMINGIWDDLTL
jgi:hypothetical protein